MKNEQENWNRKPHECNYTDEDGCHGSCEEREPGKLTLILDDGYESHGIYAPYCPFCGYKMETK